MNSSYMTPTGIASYQYCERLCFINTIYPRSGTKSEKTVLGLFEHEVIGKHAELTRHDWQKSRQSLEKVLDLNKDRISRVTEFAMKISKENFPQYLDVLKAHLDSMKLRLAKIDQKRIQFLSSLLHKGLEFDHALDVVLPWKIEQWFSSIKYNIRGRADAIYKRTDGSLLIEDIKSHNTRFDSLIHQDEHRAQLTVYAVLAEELFQIPVKQVRIFYSQDLTTENFNLTEQDKFDIIQIKKKASRVTESGIPPKLEGEDAIKCKFCYAREFCFGLDQRTDDQVRDEADFESLNVELQEKWR